MILDKRTEFCDAVALNTGSAGTYLIGSQIDLGVARDIGNDDSDLWFVVTVTTAVTSGGTTTVQFHLASDSTASIATDGSATYHYSSPAISKATLVAGYNAVRVKLPAEGAAYERYLGVLQTTATTAVGAGAVDAYLTPVAPKNTAYADAI